MSIISGGVPLGANREANLISPPSYAADTVYLLILAALAWRMTRAAQMTTQYHWLFERAGPFGWRARANVSGHPGNIPEAAP